ncbi:CxC ATPase DNA modification system associated small protein [Actinomadura verrucosospora]|uniref:CxC ATPase DNA modification system associated small protein n=1 Tax=Actinomadura verrucosospora TaxID=46165 RepID=UPI001563E71B|nr:CxC ATPase DNA modification system associated small protein [Actinomadura verrucosospora]
MSLDPKITEAIEIAVSEARQNTALARRIVAWLETLTSGNESINDPSAAARHLELLYDEVTINREMKESTE